MTNETEVTEKFLLPLYSGLGNNAYYLDDCKIVEHRPSYAACLAKYRDHLIKKEGSHGSQPCRAAMKAGTCKAMDMHMEEELAGRAMFFIDRNRLSDESLRHSAAMPSPSFVRPGSVKKVEGEKTYRSPPPDVVARRPMATGGLVSSADMKFGESSGDYADAINMAMREAMVKPEPVVVAPIAPPAPKPIAVTTVANVAKAGMSMVEIARAALASKAL
jgi:hypothetical protein